MTASIGIEPLPIEPLPVAASVTVPLPTPYGVFDVHAFERPSGHVYVAMVMGDVDGADDVLVRIHSECLTGDALGSLRCDCGVQLRTALRMISAQRCGVLVYATDHEGRGIGLVNKLRAYVAQDDGADTVDANVALGLPIDGRDYTASAGVLSDLGLRTVRLITNNPHKAAGLRAAGTRINSVIPLPTSPHHRNIAYLDTKAKRMDHRRPTGIHVRDTNTAVAAAVDAPTDVMALLGDVRPRADRPYVVLKWAQTLDGRIATATGDSNWISGEPERAVTHALRAACDSVLVGIGTVMQDDPQLTVRMVAGASPMRAILDTHLRTPVDAKILSGDAATTVFTTERSDPARRSELRDRGVRIEIVPEQDGHVSIREALSVLRSTGVESVLVEGGSEVITALLAAGLVDRVAVALAPIILGAGTQAVNDLETRTIASGIHLRNQITVQVGDDTIIAGDVARGTDEQDAARLLFA
jgi:GTP cyclohydrolase II